MHVIKFRALLAVVSLKLFLVVVSLVTSPLVSAWECESYDRYSQEIELHLDMAENVFFGRVTSGSIDTETVKEFDVSIAVDVLLEVKGDKGSKATLYTYSLPPFPEFVLGGSYLFFLYGSDNLDFCGYIIDSAGPIQSIDELRDYVLRKDLSNIQYFRKVLKYMDDTLEYF